MLLCETSLLCKKMTKPQYRKCCILFPSVSFVLLVIFFFKSVVTSHSGAMPLALARWKIRGKLLLW